MADPEPDDAAKTRYADSSRESPARARAQMQAQAQTQIQPQAQAQAQAQAFPPTRTQAGTHAQARAQAQAHLRGPRQHDREEHSQEQSLTPALHKPKKIKRISKACDFCHNRSIRCSVSNEDPARCQSCVDYDQACTYVRPTKKRGAKGGKGKVLSPATDVAESSGSAVDNARREHSQSPVYASQDLIMNLVEVFFEVIYPIYPLFHRPTLVHRVEREDYKIQGPFCAAVMALCALASARVRDGALYSTQWDPAALVSTPSSVFFSAAEDAIPQDPDGIYVDIDWMRACALLTLAALQNNDIRKMQNFLGVYSTLVRVDGLHDEKNWAFSLSIIEREERRRLFWSMYNFEVYAAAVWGSVVSCREAQSNVQYPADVDDDFLSRAHAEEVNRHQNQSVSEMTLPYSQHTWEGTGGSENWIQGWNFATDLFRVLEHAIDGFRKRSPETDHTKFVAEVWKMTLPLQSKVLEAMMHKYQSLPPRFKQTPPISMDQAQDRFSFQAANIAATMELVRMTLITSAEATAEDRCQVLSELVHTFTNVPVQYLRAMNTPILHHLAGIGTILEQVFEKPVSEATYLRVVAVIQDLARLLASLEAGMGAAAGASGRLLAQLERMDNHMQSQRLMTAQSSGYLGGQYGGSSAMGPATRSAPTPYDPIRGHDHRIQYLFPAEIFDNEWTYAFDFTQAQR